MCAVSNAILTVVALGFTSAATLLLAVFAITRSIIIGAIVAMYISDSREVKTRITAYHNPHIAYYNLVVGVLLVILEALGAHITSHVDNLSCSIARTLAGRHITQKLLYILAVVLKYETRLRIV
jgi:hypothetical protein